MIVSWNTTRACNIHCIHCYRDAGTCEAGELTTAAGKKLLTEIVQAGFKIGKFCICYNTSRRQ
jgi:MoaA/NifB/PqqE/SkfB family radical SAM enzyme